MTVQQAKNLPKKRGKSLLGLTSKYQLPDLSEIDEAPSFAKVSVTWNDDGLGVAINVTGKKKSLQCNPKKLDTSDSCHLWIDTRDTKTVHRATRFCHHFILLPTGEGTDKNQPSLLHHPISNAREAAPATDAKSITLKCNLKSDGYLLECWLPKTALNGFDPQSSRKLGFYYAIKDSELGEQSLGVGSEFPIHYDPSLWATLELEN